VEEFSPAPKHDNRLFPQPVQPRHKPVAIKGKFPVTVKGASASTRFSLKANGSERFIHSTPTGYLL
jgi:hypothetical protein